MQLLIHMTAIHCCAAHSRAMDFVTVLYQNIFNLHAPGAECHAWPRVTVMRR